MLHGYILAPHSTSPAGGSSSSVLLLRGGSCSTAELVDYEDAFCLLWLFVVLLLVLRLASLSGTEDDAPGAGERTIMTNHHAS